MPIVEPYGGKLVNSIIGDPLVAQEWIESCHFEVDLDERQLCDTEMLMTGGFSPLEGFMTEEEFKSVCSSTRLPSGLLFGLPVVLATDDERLTVGRRVLLKHHHVPIAVLDVSARYTPDKAAEARDCYGSTSLTHPAVSMIAQHRGSVYIGGKVTGLNRPRRRYPCASPAEVRASLPADCSAVVAFQCRNPLHRAHMELVHRAQNQVQQEVQHDGKVVVLIHPTMGPTQAGDISADVRYDSYIELQKELAASDGSSESYSAAGLHWAYLPYSMHMGGPREALQHMIIRRNFGCSHFIVGRDMAGCKSTLDGKDFYEAYEAQNLAMQHAEELGIAPVTSQDLLYTKEKGFATSQEAKQQGLEVQKLSGTRFRQLLRDGQTIPSWFAFASVIKVLSEARDKEAAAASQSTGSRG